MQSNSSNEISAIFHVLTYHLGFWQLYSVFCKGGNHEQTCYPFPLQRSNQEQNCYALSSSTGIIKNESFINYLLERNNQEKAYYTLPFLKEQSGPSLLWYLFKKVIKYKPFIISSLKDQLMTNLLYYSFFKDHSMTKLLYILFFKSVIKNMFVILSFFRGAIKNKPVKFSLL